MHRLLFSLLLPLLLCAEDRWIEFDSGPYQVLTNAGDKAGHTLSVLKSTCTWTTPLEMAGGKSKDGTSVAFAENPLSLIHLGTRGCLEYFHTTFMGPEQKVVLDPRPSLPSA